MKAKGKIRNIVNAVIFFFILSIVCFLVVQLVPGDPVRARLGESIAVLSEEEIEQLRDSYGLNDPIVVQYIKWIGNIFKGDFGNSITSGQPVISEIRRTIGTTLLLALGAVIVIAVISVPYLSKISQREKIICLNGCRLILSVAAV
ncbi:MAG: ABC transporter permease [Lachnospiraceae bacterium]|nr:ABC transporter permease [Lachnospiraceae bacterium]